MDNRNIMESGMPNFSKTGVPRTDEDAIDALQRHVCSDIGKLSIAGIYRCRRQMGDGINDAIIYCLELLVPRERQ